MHGATWRTWRRLLPYTCTVRNRSLEINNWPKSKLTCRLWRETFLRRRQGSRSREIKTDICGSDVEGFQLTEPSAGANRTAPEDPAFAKILYWSHATPNAEGKNTAIKSLKIDSVALEVRTLWYQGERHSSACRDGGRSEELKAGSNLICSVYDSLTLLIILRVKPISPDCVQLVSRQSSMEAAEVQPNVCEHSVTLEDVKNKNFSTRILFFSSASSSCGCLINQNALKWIP